MWTCGYVKYYTLLLYNVYVCAIISFLMKSSVLLNMPNASQHDEVELIQIQTNTLHRGVKLARKWPKLMYSHTFLTRQLSQDVIDRKNRTVF